MLFALLLLNLSCANKDKQLHTYDNDIKIQDVEKIDTSEDILSLNTPYCVKETLSFVIALDELENTGVISVVRFNQGRFYSITPLETGDYLILLYEKNDNYYNQKTALLLVDGFIVSQLTDSSDFKVTNGMSRDEVLALDKSSVTMDNYTYHRLSDKSVIRIEYENDDGQFFVSNITKIATTNSVINYLTSDDFKLLTK